MTINNKKIFNLADNKAPFIRICLIAVVLLGGLLLTVFNLPPITDGIGEFLEAIHLGFAVTVMFAGFSWGFAKWAVFIFPKSLALANRAWNGLFAWGIIGLAIKAMIWLYILCLPATLYGVVLLPVGLLVYGLSLLGLGVVSELLLTAIFVAAVCFMVFLDVCKLTDKSWWQTLRAVFSGTRKLTVLKAR